MKRIFATRWYLVLVWIKQVLSPWLTGSGRYFSVSLSWVPTWDKNRRISSNVSKQNMHLWNPSLPWDFMTWLWNHLADLKSLRQPLHWWASARRPQWASLCRWTSRSENIFWWHTSQFGIRLRWREEMPAALDWDWELLGSDMFSRKSVDKVEQCGGVTGSAGIEVTFIGVYDFRDLPGVRPFCVQNDTFCAIFVIRLRWVWGWCFFKFCSWGIHFTSKKQKY